LILTGINNYIGATIVSSGVLQAASATALSSNSSFNVLGTVDLKGNSNTIGSLTGSGNVTDNGTLAFDRSDTVTFSGVISGPGSLVQSGVGTLVLTANSNLSGTTTISAGILQFGNGGTTGGVNSSAIIDNGVLVVDRSDSFTYAGTVSGTGSGVKDGVGTLTLTGNNTYSGGTTINAGTLQLGNGGTTGSITGNVTDNGTLAFDRSDSVTFGGLINGTGTLVNLGSSALILTGNNSYSGGTAVDNGTVVTASNGALGTGPVSITDLASTYKSTRA